MKILQRGAWVVPLTIAAAFVVQALPLPMTAAVWTPNWVTLVLLYWCMAAPRQAGLGLGFVAGLVADVLETTLLGQQALAKCAAVVLMVWQRRRFRMYHPWQQACLMPLPLVLEALVSAAVRTVTGDGDALLLADFAPALTTALVWPLVVPLLRALQRLSGMRG